MSLADQVEQAVRRGACLLADEGRNAVIDFLRSKQEPAGLFRGPGGEGDLYYTLFGLSAWLAMEQEVPANLPHVLQEPNPSDLDLVHRACLLRCRRLCGVAGEKETRSPGTRRADIGVYEAFLALLAYGPADLRFASRRALNALLRRARLADGGYARMPGERTASTPGTAAAVVLLRELGKHDEAASAWLRARECRGCFAATEGAPTADLLSTAVALFALRDAEKRCNREHAKNSIAFIHDCWSDEGGFRPSPDHGDADVEYTWYALLALGCVL